MPDHGGGGRKKKLQQNQVDLNHIVSELWAQKNTFNVIIE